VSEPSTEPQLAELLRHNLTDIVTEGLQPYHVAEKGLDLLRLQIVRSRVELPPKADEDQRDDAFTKALTLVLAQAVEKMEAHRKSRKVLKFVLPLKEEFLGTPIKERRAAAAKEIKDGKKTVKPGTIRTYYEPRALERLANVLVEMEAQFIAEHGPPDASVKG
jgi:hypothetical protein